MQDGISEASFIYIYMSVLSSPPPSFILFTALLYSPETNNAIVSKSAKYSVKFFPMIHATMTKIGIMPAAIWIEDPTATPIVISVLPFMAIQTDVTCSAALPTRGRRIKPKAMDGAGSE